MVFLGFHVSSEIPVLIEAPVHITRATSMTPTYRHQKLLIRFPLKPDVCICKIESAQSQACDLNLLLDAEDIENAPPVLISDIGEWDIVGTRGKLSAESVMVAKSTPNTKSQ